MRALERWMWRGLGALIVGASIHIWMPRDHRVPTATAPRADETRLTALRLTDGNLALPAFTLWGAGPPADLQYHVAVSVPFVEPAVLKPDTAPLRKAPPSPAQPTKLTPVAMPVVPPVAVPAPQTDWRPAAFRAPTDGEAAPTGAAQTQKAIRKAQPVSAKCAESSDETVFSFGVDTAVDSPVYPKIASTNRCAKR